MWLQPMLSVWFLQPNHTLKNPFYTYNIHLLIHLTWFNNVVKLIPEKWPRFYKSDIINWMIILIMITFRLNLIVIYQIFLACTDKYIKWHPLQYFFSYWIQLLRPSADKLLQLLLFLGRYFWGMITRSNFMRSKFTFSWGRN